MRITLEHVGKKYGKSWIFKNVNLSFEPGQTYAILGNNGSGKSTLLKLLSGQTAPNQGEIEFENTAIEKVYQKISFCAPYIVFRLCTKVFSPIFLPLYIGLIV